MSKILKPASLPAHLGPIWDEMELQVAPGIGRAGLESLCGQIHRARTAREQIDREGALVVDGRGNPVAHPLLAVERAAQIEIREWMRKYARS